MGRFSPHRDDTFLACYPRLLRAFAALDPIERDTDFVLAVHAVYGWMPAMLDLHLPEGSGHREALGHLIASASKEKQIHALGTLAGCIGTVPKLRKGKWTSRGKSLVGVSKLLHFLRPDHWPIWDRRVAAVWPLARPLPESYWQYSEELRNLADASSGVADEVNAKLAEVGLPDPVTHLRALEMLLFYGGKAA